jgi:hypothetical protein
MQPMAEGSIGIAAILLRHPITIRSGCSFLSKTKTRLGSRVVGNSYLTHATRALYRRVICIILTKEILNKSNGRFISSIPVPRFGRRIVDISISRSSVSKFIFLAHFTLTAMGASEANFRNTYKGIPYQDSQHPNAPQQIPGQVECAYYDHASRSHHPHTHGWKHESRILQLQEIYWMSAGHNHSATADDG